uniref:Aluminum-activated malate transporter n=1 Tax=Kalanchoe fedtschenkoi TaxID=63787 RepID=A0A7N0RAS2_KALFE
MGKEESGKLEWRINVPGGTSKPLEPTIGLFSKIWLGLNALVLGFVFRVRHFFGKAWDIGVAEPRKVMHCLKVGIALTFVSLFYYMRPLYDGVGGNAIWAVMTVVVVFEYTVGATLNKSINRATATFLAGSLGLGVHWVATQSGQKFEPVIIGLFVFILASATTFSRFIPSVKARFDYGALIFILTFSLVSVSGYRVDKLFELAHQRVVTIAIGTSLCILISMLISPVWAGLELHLLINRNLEKLADSLDVCISEYFRENNGDPNKEGEDQIRKLQGYKCVLNSKAAEDSMANFARWEPPHGHFNFRHPWKQYLKIGTAIRSCAYCIETLTGCVDFGVQTSDLLSNQLKDVCVKLSSASTSVLRELSSTVKCMTRSPKLDFLVGEMNSAIQELQNASTTAPQQLVRSSPQQTVDTSNNFPGEHINGTEEATIMQVLPLATLVTLIMEVAARIELVVDAVDELATLAKFKQAVDTKPGRVQPKNEQISYNQNQEAIGAVQML